MNKLLVTSLLMAGIFVSGCQKQSAPSFPRFASEDECEDAGMSDSFCDAMFPEAEDFYKKKKKPYQQPPVARSAPIKPSLKDRAKAKVKSYTSRSSSSNRSKR